MAEEPAPKRARAERTVAITGATSRFGPELVGWFCRLGRVVHGCGGDAGDVAALAAAEPSATLSVVDVSDDAALGAWFATVGAVEIIVCNAAVAPTLRPPPEEYAYERRLWSWELSAADVGACVDANIKGVANALRRGVPRLLERSSGGTFVALTGGHHLVEDPEHAPVAAAEAAIDVLVTRAARCLPAPLVAARLASGATEADVRRGVGPGWADRCGMMVLSLDRSENGCTLAIPPDRPDDTAGAARAVR